MTKPTEMWAGFLEELRGHLIADDVKNFLTWGVIRRTMFTSDSQHSGVLEYFEENIGKLSDIEEIFEFGAGHGRICGMIHDRGFKGKYTILDFPELSKLQKHYLSHLDNIEYTNDLDNIVAPQSDKSLFISMSAIEEAPDDVAHKMLEYAEKFNNFLFKYSGGRSLFLEFANQNGTGWHHKELDRSSVYLSVGGSK